MPGFGVVDSTATCHRPWASHVYGPVVVHGLIPLPRTRPNDTFPVRFCVMSRSAITPGATIRGLPTGVFVRLRDLPGSPEAVRNALTRAVARKELRRVRQGLYFKGTKTSFGLTRPTTRQLVHEVVGTRGVGPANYSAAAFLGLTTQVPAKEEYSIAGPVPDGEVFGAKLHSRSNRVREDLNEYELAILEVNLDPSRLVESGWPALVSVVRDAVAKGEVNMAQVRRAAEAERWKRVLVNVERLERDLVAAA